MTATLIQRQLLSTSTYTLEYNGIRVLEKSPNKQYSYVVPFENIPGTPFFLRTYNKFAVLTTVVCVFLSIIMGPGIFASGSVSFGTILFLVLLVGLPLASVWFSRTELTGYGLPGNGFIIHARKPSKETADRFLREMHKAKITYFHNMYITKQEPASHHEEMRQLLWFKELGVISEEEYQKKMQAVSTEKETHSLGFSKG